MVETIETFVLDILPIGVILSSLEGIPIYKNPIAQRIFDKDKGLFLKEHILATLENVGSNERPTGKLVEINNANIFIIWHIYLGKREPQLLILMLELEVIGDFAQELTMAKELSRELEALFASSYDEIFVTDGQGKTLRVNGVCERHYGLKAEEMVGRYVKDLEESRVFTPSATLMALEKKQRVTMLQDTGNGRQVIATANPVFDKDNNITRVVSNTRDVTELIQLGEQLEKALDQVSTYRTKLAELRSINLKSNLVVHSPEMEKVLSLVRKVAPFDTTILLLGETGSGKNAISKFIHKASIRSKGPFIEIDCGAIPQNLLESELFGYEPGAFTGANKLGKVGLIEMAEGGTLFLDEIGELPLNLQVKLLRFIQERQLIRVGGTKVKNINIRIIAATNKDLAFMVTEGNFRKDLYYRLNVIPIRIPPLRDRQADIPHLVKYFLSNYNTRYNSTKSLTTDVLDAFCRYDWPGNIRELENILEHLVVISDEDTIRISTLPESFLQTLNGSNQGIKSMSLKDAVENAEIEILTQGWASFHNTYIMAEHLGISQATVVRKLQKYDIR